MVTIKESIRKMFESAFLNEESSEDDKLKHLEDYDNLINRIQSFNSSEKAMNALSINNQKIIQRLIDAEMDYSNIDEEEAFKKIKKYPTGKKLSDLSAKEMQRLKYFK